MSNALDLNSISELKLHIKTFDEKLNEQFLTLPVQSLLKRRAKHIDEMLVSLWKMYHLHNTSMSLNAVGGYGRRALHPRSDIDLAIIVEQELTPQQQEQLSLFLTRLWDFGLDIGQTVRTLSESIASAKSDITIATNLLDIRCLVGSKKHAQSIKEQLYQDELWTSLSFYDAKMDEQLQRHNKAQNTALYLEPNLKNNPGGLRDVHTIMWIAQKHFSLANANALKTIGFLQQDEVYELLEAYDFICRVRWALHCVTQSAQDVLLFEHQAAVAEFMHFGQGDNSQLAIERMMRQLFRAMTRVRELNQIICDSFRLDTLNETERSNLDSIDKYFSVCNGLIEVKFTQAFIDKRQVMRMFKLLAENDNIEGIAPKTLRLLRQTRRGLLGELQDYQGCREEFLAILSHPKGLRKCLGLMHRYGVLAAYCSQWHAIEGQMQFDMHNAFTVDEHTFKAIQYIDSFALNKKNSLTYTIYQNISNRFALVFATLCHHLSGKQTIENSELSAIQAKELAEEHLLKGSTTSLIYWLVANQNLLISAIQTQDISEPDVIKHLAKSVGSQDKLNALFLFTIADMMATNESYWNDWQESQLTLLYMAIRDALKQGIENIFEVRTVIRENQADAKPLLLQQGIDETRLSAFWHTLPNNFFSSNSVADIVEITQHILTTEPGTTRVFAGQNSDHGFTSLFVYTQDRAKLFVDLFKTLASSKLKVKDAQMMQTKDGRVLEIIKVLDHKDEPIDDEPRIEQIIKRIFRAIERRERPRKLMTPRALKNFDSPPVVTVLHTTKKNRALLKVNSLDDPIYLEQICNLLSERNLVIHSAKISTLGECTENVFMVSNAEKTVFGHDEQLKLVDIIEEEIA
ncbi:[protein-PII] uridylyltransferase [Shewanella schlegeliana]|uniref:Bifunctional uridylyltransferase/uridylyl-removing enzyme n=1 Tax=Shewanella schlegeliana TaxID=190308 RepID=A0ABS1T3A1_9GAMM|nr:[protein-PII] uridylyltransferase [Shewanella schlegeliana]MBL4914297.1 [protein-PII] uridylyltransferase [Shewanella schlegeliana]MCL1109480.1 [protein-PII] uridylyltransferase [Shewanella schlegeliana]GIU33529.1 bifunctional uridylyltransferase/uridylyl-removing enzyme [Shewanella schlegeliana]